MTLVQRSFSSELGALLAGAKKEWLIFRRYPSWMVVYIIWPFLGPLPYVFAAKAMSGPDGSGVATFSALAGTTDYTSYMVLGISMWMWLNMTLWDVGFQLRNEQMRGTLESNWLCPVWRLSIMLGSGVAKFVPSTFSLVVTVIEFRLLAGVQLVGGNVGLILLILLLTMLAIYGIGLAFASLVIRFREANSMVFLVRGIFMIFCGLTFPLQVLPAWMQKVASFLPLTYAIQGIRRVTLAGASFGEVLPDLRSLAIFAVLMPAVGCLTFRFAERRSRRTGALGQY